MLLFLKIYYCFVLSTKLEENLEWGYWASDEGNSLSWSTKLENCGVYVENKAVQADWSKWRGKVDSKEMVLWRDSKGRKDGLKLCIMEFLYIN